VREWGGTLLKIQTILKNTNSGFFLFGCNRLLLTHVLQKGIFLWWERSLLTQAKHHQLINHLSPIVWF